MASPTSASLAYGLRQRTAQRQGRISARRWLSAAKLTRSDEPRMKDVGTALRAFAHPAHATHQNQSSAE